MHFYPPPAFYRFVQRYFHLLFWPVLAAALLVAFIELKDRTYLQNEKAPKGIGSLELGPSQAVDKAIVASWKMDTLDLTTFDECRGSAPTINRLRKARTDIYLDYGFILLYTALAIIIIAALQARAGREGKFISSLLVWLALLAGICDGVENWGMLRFIRDGFDGGTEAGDPAARLTRTMALTKFVILGLLTVIYLPYTLIFRDKGLQWLSAYVRGKALQLFRYRVILVSVLLFSLPIWVMDQGQDLLVNSNSSDIGVLLFMTVVLAAAFLNWWLSKLFFEQTYRGPVFPLTEPVLSDPIQQGGEKRVSRYLGICTILIPAVAILNALQVLRIHFPLDIFPPMLWLVALLALFFVLIQQDIACRLYLRAAGRWGEKISRRIVIFILFLSGFLLPVLIRLLVLREETAAPGSLIWLFYHLLLLAFSFWIFVSTRNNVFPENGWLGKKIGRPIVLVSLILALLFVYFNLFPLRILALDCNYLSLPLLLAGIIFYILLFTFLIRISLCKKINFVFFIVALGLIISAGSSNDYHAVNLTPSPSAITSSSPSGPLPLNQYFRSWLLARTDEIDSTPDSYPVFLVNSYGGGIKAAAFTNMVVTYLDGVTLKKGRSHKAFEHYVFSISGASGGTIGAAVQCAYRARHIDRDSGAYHLDSFQDFYGHDFLTPVLSNALGRDVWASAIGYPLWKDRSAIQEYIWAGFGQRSLGIDLGQDFNAIWDTARTNPARFEVPLLFSNTLNVDDGLKGIMTAVSLTNEDFPGTIFIRDRITALREEHRKDKDSLLSISLATGAFLSARFPFISPSGKMGPGYHFMDGGGKDNSGASTSEAIFLSLARLACREMGSPNDSVFLRLMKKVRFYFVSITNSPYYDPDTRKLVSNRFEPVSPLVGIINSGIYGNAQTADNILQFRYSSDSTQFRGIRPDYSSVWVTGSCVPDGKAGFYKPVLPLGWQISAPSLARLRRSFDEDMIRSYNPAGIRKIIKILGVR